MPAWINKLFAPFRKDNPAYPIYSQVVGLGTPIYTPKEFRVMAKESHEKNITCYRAVSLISESCAGIPWKLYKKGDKQREITDHPLLELFDQPNPEHSLAEFIEEVISFWILSGNSYIVAVRPGQRATPTELWTLRPDRMQVIPGLKGVSGYEYRMDAIKTNFTAKDILHLKMFSATNDWYGLSPILVAMDLIDQQNEGNDWNVSLLQNAGRPSGALVATGTLGPDQFDRLKKLIRERYIGKRNAGLPLLLEGGLTWQSLSMSPLELDWLQSRQQNMRDIAIALGVPPELLGDSANKTYCLPADTRIMTPSGPIEIVQIIPGDYVYSLDDTYHMVERKVLWAGKVGKKSLHKITAGHQTVKATGNHPFLVYRGDHFHYIQASFLRLGDLVVLAYLYPHLADGCGVRCYKPLIGVPEYCEAVPITALEWLPAEDVYDIEVEDHHNFFAENFCVHNSNYQEARKSFYQETILPVMDKLRDRLNVWLVPQFDPSLYLDYDKEEIEALQEDRDSLSNRVSMQWGNGIITLNEVRLALGLDEIPGGDILQLKATGVYYVPTASLTEVVEQKIENLLAPPTAMPNSGTVPSTAPDTDNPTSDTSQESNTTGQERALTEASKMQHKSSSSEPLINRVEQLIMAYFEKEGDFMTALTKKAAFPETVFPRLKGAVNRTLVAWEGMYDEIYQMVGQFAGEQIYKDLGLSDFVFWKTETSLYAKARAIQMIPLVEQKTLEELSDATSYGVAKKESVAQIADRVGQVYQAMKQDQAKAIAEIETQIATNYGQYIAAKASGVIEYKIWHCMHDQHTRPAHQDADNQKVLLDKPFIVMDEKLMFPKDTSLGATPGNTYNCRCHQTFEQKAVKKDPGLVLQQVEELLSTLETKKKYRIIKNREESVSTAITVHTDTLPSETSSGEIMTSEEGTSVIVPIVEERQGEPLPLPEEELVDQEKTEEAPTESKSRKASYKSFMSNFVETNRG